MKRPILDYEGPEPAGKARGSVWKATFAAVLMFILCWFPIAFLIAMIREADPGFVTAAAGVGMLLAPFGAAAWVFRSVYKNL